MKLIVTGSSGTIGGGCLVAALVHPQVSTVISLVRKKFAKEGSAEGLETRPVLKKVMENPEYATKLQEVVVGDWQDWKSQPEVMKACEGASGVLWALGNGATGDEMEKKMQVLRDFPNAFLDQVVLASDSTQPFRAVIVGGQITVMDPEASTWILPGLRKAAGAMYRAMIEKGSQNAPRLDVYMANPAVVYDSPGYWPHGLTPGLTISRWDLGAAMVDIVMNGRTSPSKSADGSVKSWDPKTWWNSALSELGKASRRVP